ncbi:uncharacterized protein I206_104458 [Kwoniella pini CBS 10737]|uniref:Phytase-like domain-containing protein n=1 Tax=Kwoniella pini CBS 10737 TaxID=1296096 RepID=A0A1B9I1L9_9TREE|nr:uncharacterized protein I206_03961 [Kwoniella pini CBS 10737]OCF49440.1 hypothetical protein I206_03961 [Kwoniella pini CBS 10737]
MKSAALSILLPLLALVHASPIQRQADKKLLGRHIIDGRQIAHGSGLSAGHALASTTIFLEDSEGLALVTSSNFTTVIVETPSNSAISTLIAAWGSQPIYSLGQNAGYILGIPEHVYAPFEFPQVDASDLPLQVCTFVFAETADSYTNYTAISRNAFVVEDFAKQLNLADAVTEFCVRVGQAPTSTSTSSTVVSLPAPITTAGNNGNGNGNANPSVAPDAPHSSQLPSTTKSTSPSTTPLTSDETSASTKPYSVSSAISIEPVSSKSQVQTSATSGPSSPSAATSAVISASSAVSSAPNASPSKGISGAASAASSTGSTTASRSASHSNAASVTSSVIVSASSVPVTSATSVGVSSIVSEYSSVGASASAPNLPTTSIHMSSSAAISTSLGASASVSVSTSASSSAASSSTSATPTLTGPDPAYQTMVTFAGKTYINKGLVGFGAIDGDAIDSFGETIGSLGSAIYLQSMKKTANGSYTGVMVTQPDRGHNTDTTTDYVSRRHFISFNLNPYYGNTSLEYQAAKSSFALKYESTLKYVEADGTPTTGLNPESVRNGSIPQPIASQSYNHISTDPEGLVILADGTSWVSDEYGPYIWKYSAEGILLDTIVPPKAVLPYRNGSLYFDAESSIGPDTGRVQNQGFEGLTVSPDGKTLYALMQSGLTQDLDKNGSGRYARMFIYDISGQPILKHSYVVELPVTNGKGKTLAQSDVAYISENTFMLLSRDGKGNGNDDSESKHKDFMLFNLDGATDLVNTEYTNGVKPVSPKGTLESNITAIVPVEFIDMIDDTQLDRFGLHNGGTFDVSLINGKWESAALASLEDPQYPNDYFLFSFSDNDFITTNGFEAGEKYVDQYGSTLDNQALVWRITLP